MSTVRHLLQIKGNDVWTVSPDTSVFEALRLMANKNVGAILVVEGEKLVGILSERDYARKVILLGKASRDTLVRDIMTSKVITVHPEQTVDECMELMTNNRVRHLPVVVDDKILGVVSIGDVVRDTIYTQRQKIKDLEKHVLG